MIIKLFSIYDKKAVAFGQLFPSNTSGSAERSFHEALKNPDTPYAKYPEDYVLYQIAEFDDESGYIVKTFEPPLHVVDGVALLG